MDELIRTLVEDGWLGHLIRTAVVVVLALAVSFLARRVGTRAVARIEQKNPRNARRATTWWLVMRRVVNVVVFIVVALSASLNDAVTAVFVRTPETLAGGVMVVTIGGVVSGAVVVLNTTSTR